MVRQNLAWKAVLGVLVVVIFAMNAEAQKTTAVTSGIWGGTGMNMTVSATGATIEFDCATAEIGKQLRKTRTGMVETTGTLTHSGPGPIRVGREPQARSVIFKGKVSGDTFNLTVTDADTGEALGKYSLTKGKTGRIRRCL